MSIIRCYDKDGSIIDELYQWDKNVKVTISGIDTSNVSELHFCNRKSKVALRVSVDKTGNSISAYIPGDLLCQPESIIVFICESLSDGEIKTTHVCRIPIHPRPKASDSYYEDDMQDSVVGINIALGSSSLIINYALDTGANKVDTFTLDTNGYPTSLNVNGKYSIPISWVGSGDTENAIFAAMEASY